MPFNEKGEFIRSPSTARQANSSRPRSAVTSWGTLFSSTRISIARVLAAVVGLAVVIWLVVAFREWFMIGLGLWLVSRARKFLD